MLVALVIIAGSLGLGLWQYRKRTNPVLDSIPGPPATSWFEGHVQTQFGRDAWGFFRMLETKYGPVAKLKGPLGTNWLYTWDPAAIHSILASGQASFDAIEELVEGFHFFLGPGLNGVAGHTHKKQRRMLQPVFSTKHIRELTPIFCNVSKKLVAALSRNVGGGLREVNVMNWLDLASLELMGQATIGYSFDLLTEDAPPDPFAAAIKSYILTFFTPDTVIYRQLILLSKKLGMLSVARWIVDHTPSPAIRRLRAVSRILHEKSAKVVREKKEALAMGGLGSRKDIISTLLRANSSEESKDRLPDDQLIAQISVFFLAATDTTSNTLARILHVLAEHPDVQTKLREEILAAGDGGDLTYEALQALPYLDAVVKETLRVYVPVPINHRQAYRDTTLPLSKPVHSTSGTPISSIPISKGTIVVMYLPACNRNPALWGADADAWRPERWLEHARAPVAEEEVPIPSPYARLMTFLGGGRACIGFQFAVLEIKVVLASLLANFTFAPSPDKPVFWNHSGIVYPSLGMDSPAPEMWLNVERYRSAAHSR